jgi:hypothetical protein
MRLRASLARRSPAESPSRSADPPPHTVIRRPVGRSRRTVSRRSILLIVGEMLISIGAILCEVKQRLASPYGDLDELRSIILCYSRYSLNTAQPQRAQMTFSQPTPTRVLGRSARLSAKGQR